MCQTFFLEPPLWPLQPFSSGCIIIHKGHLSDTYFHLSTSELSLICQFLRQKSWGGWFYKTMRHFWKLDQIIHFTAPYKLGLGLNTKLAKSSVKLKFEQHRYYLHTIYILYIQDRQTKLWKCSFEADISNINSASFAVPIQCKFILIHLPTYTFIITFYVQHMFSCLLIDL